ncbi:hypothetical protein ACFRMQ_21735 [Kitasatospora sp. NPDC056783]|uniref:hypothetical protein n=1 Tax=Kitasatospora sp. NPDC056783 TaxID=3345943 RepID=UPI003696698A
MSHIPVSGRVLLGRPTSGKQPLPADAPVGEFVAQLRRAVHTIECREAGPEAARQRFGLFADRTQGRQVLFADPDRLLAEHPGEEELRDMVQAVRERGPAVGVVLIPPSR